jgi:hypothetical protein
VASSSPPSLGTTFVNRFGELSSNYVSPATSRDESLSSLSQKGSQGDQLSDDGQELNLQDLVKELRYDEHVHRDGNWLRPESSGEEKKELDMDEALKTPRPSLTQAWFDFYHQEQPQPQQPDPPEEIPPTPSEISSSVVSSAVYGPRPPDPPSAQQRDRSVASSSAASARSTASALKTLETPFAFMMSRSAEDILNVTTEEMEMSHYMSERDRDRDKKEKLTIDSEMHLQTPRASTGEQLEESTPALLPRPPQAASPGPSPLSSFPTQRSNTQSYRNPTVNAYGSSPHRKAQKLPPVGRLATPPPPPPGPPPQSSRKAKTTTQQPQYQGLSPSRQHRKPPSLSQTTSLQQPGTAASVSTSTSTNSSSALPSGALLIRHESGGASGPAATGRAVPPIMRIRLGIEEPNPISAADLQREAIDGGAANASERVISPTETIQTETTDHTEGTDNQTGTSLEESEYIQQRRNAKKKKKRIAQGIRRTLSRSHGRRSDRRRRVGGSSRSAASSTLGRSIDDDESSFYSTADLSCQSILSRLIQTRCGNLEDSASLCENSESDDEIYDESVASTLYSERKKDGRIVSFDDESDDRDARQQKVLMLKQKKQLKNRPGEPDVALDESKGDNEDRNVSSVEADNTERQSVISDGGSNQGSKSVGGSKQATATRDRLDMAPRQSSSFSARGSGAGARSQGWVTEQGADEGLTEQPEIVPEEFVRGTSFYGETEQAFENSSASESKSSKMSSSSQGSRDSPQGDDDAAWHDIEGTRAGESLGVFDQQWHVYGDANEDALHAPTRPESEVHEVIWHITKAATTVGTAIRLNEVDMHDRNFIKTFVSIATTTGFPLLHHSPSKKLMALPAPTKVTVHVRFGAETPAGEYTEPRVTWSSADGATRGAIEIFDIDSLDRASPTDVRSYPLALPSKSIIFRTEHGDKHVFEAMDDDVAYRFVHGMRWVVARLAFNLIIGNLNVSCELLDMDGDEGVSPEGLGKQMLMKAMNDVTNHLVNKSVAE